MLQLKCSHNHYEMNVVSFDAYWLNENKKTFFYLPVLSLGLLFVDSILKTINICY